MKARVFCGSLTFALLEERQGSVYYFAKKIIVNIKKTHTSGVAVESRDRDHRETELQRLQDEVKDLRQQLNKSASALGDYGELRRELERSEKQRQQLSDHIEVSASCSSCSCSTTSRLVPAAAASCLSTACGCAQVLGKDMEERERQGAKMITQLQTVTDKFTVADRQRETLESSLEDTARYAHVQVHV